jgi:hypothetical protein
VRVEGEHILGTLISPGALFRGAFVHGWGGDQRQYVARARELAALGCVCLTFDLRGHAQTQTRYDSVSREDSLRDILAAYDFLAAQQNVDSDSIAVVGSSYGGYLGALLTGKRPVKWLALRVPALYKDSEWSLPKLTLRGEQALEKYRLQAVGPEESKALRACRAFTGDVLLVESEHDTVIPHQVIVNYREACISARSLTYRMIEVPTTDCRANPCRPRTRRSSPNGSPRSCSARSRLRRRHRSPCRAGPETAPAAA